jgi:non-ribosomal peptide synthetase component F
VIRGTQGDRGKCGLHHVYLRLDRNDRRGSSSRTRAIASHCLVCGEAYGIGPRDSVLQFASLSFDPSVEQIFTALTSGARLAVRGEEFWSAAELYGQIVAAGVDSCESSDSVLARGRNGNLPAPSQPPREHSLRLMIVGGEAMMPDALRQWRRSVLGAVRLLNAYGPTEATVTSLLYDCSGLPMRGSRGASTRVPLGRPLSNRSSLCP